MRVERKRQKNNAPRPDHRLCGVEIVRLNRRLVFPSALKRNGRRRMPAPVPKLGSGRPGPEASRYGLPRYKWNVPWQLKGVSGQVLYSLGLSLLTVRLTRALELPGTVLVLIPTFLCGKESSPALTTSWVLVERPAEKRPSPLAPC